MTVESELGIGPDLVDVVQDSWPTWVALQPVLAAVEDPTTLLVWIQDADVELADQVVYALARLASIDAHDDADAARVLAWLLVPGASFMSRRLRTLCSDIDHVVAAELWILVRTFPLHRRKVIVNLMRDLLTRVLAAGEAPSSVRRTEPVWFFTTGLTGAAEDVAMPTASATDGMEELEEVLAWAFQRQVIADADRRLLLLLVEAAQDVDLRAGLANGLLCAEVTQRVARVLGVCDRTVRRRARRSIAALASAVADYTRIA